MDWRGQVQTGFYDSAVTGTIRLIMYYNMIVLHAGSINVPKGSESLQATCVCHFPLLLTSLHLTLRQCWSFIKVSCSVGCHTCRSGCEMSDLCYFMFPCLQSSEIIVEDAQFNTDKVEESLEEYFNPRVRRRFTSSPKNTAKIDLHTPALTPISLSKYLLSGHTHEFWILVSIEAIMFHCRQS